MSHPCTTSPFDCRASARRALDLAGTDDISLRCRLRIKSVSRTSSTVVALIIPSQEEQRSNFCQTESSARKALLTFDGTLVNSGEFRANKRHAKMQRALKFMAARAERNVNSGLDRRDTFPDASLRPLSVNALFEHIPTAICGDRPRPTSNRRLTHLQCRIRFNAKDQLHLEVRTSLVMTQS